VAALRGLPLAPAADFRDTSPWLIKTLRLH
jgi:hypothetical protein